MNRLYRVLLVFGLLLTVGLAVQSRFMPLVAAADTTLDNGLLYTSEVGRFDVMMPMPISLHEQTVTYSFDLHPYLQLSGPSLDCHQLGAKDYGAVWFVVYCDYPPEALKTLTADQILDDARDSAFHDGAAVLENESKITFDNRIPGRTFLYQLDLREFDSQGNPYTDTYKAHAYIDGNRLYWIGAIVTAENLDNRLSLIDPFLDSFYIEAEA